MSDKYAQKMLEAKNAGWSQEIKSEADERAVLDGYWFDERAAGHVCKFFERFLKHTRGDMAGRPFKLIPWQRDDFLRPLFGWMRPCGQRRFAVGDVFIAKKTGKSTTVAGITNYMMMTGGARTECYGAAYTREQAGIIYREAAAMCKSSPELAKRLQTRDSQKRILRPDNGSFYQALASEAGAVEGLNPSFVAFDEIHVQKNRVLYEALVYGDIAQANSLFLSVSTVGVADITSIWWEQYEYAQAIISGVATDHHRFALIYEADAECKHSATLRADPAQWAKACPSLGYTVMPEKYEQNVASAENSPRKLSNLLRYLFNLPTAGVAKCVPVDKWRKCEAPDPTSKRDICFLGLDVASHEDITALVALFPQPSAAPYLKCWAWCPEDRVRQRELRNMAYYREWVNDGELLETSGNRIDQGIILAQINELVADFQVEELGFDQWNADGIVNPLAENGVQCVQVSQGFTGMTAGTKGLLSAIEECQVGHEGNRVFEWCLSNCAAATKDGGKADDSDFDEGAAIRFDKAKSADKIDIAVAAAIAWGRWLAHTEQGKPRIF